MDFLFEDAGALTDWLVSQESGGDEAVTQARRQKELMQDILEEALEEDALERFRAYREAARYLHRLELERLYRQGLRHGARFQRFLTERGGGGLPDDI